MIGIRQELLMKYHFKLFVLSKLVEAIIVYLWLL